MSEFKGFIEVTPMNFIPDYKSDNPYDGDTMAGNPIMVSVDNIGFVEGSYMELQNGRQYSLLESYDQIKQLIKQATEG